MRSQTTERNGSGPSLLDHASGSALQAEREKSIRTVITRLVTQQHRRPLPTLWKRPLTWVEMRGFEPLTPSMRSIRIDRLSWAFELVNQSFSVRRRARLSRVRHL
jgi:hypothetical protein